MAVHLSIGRKLSIASIAVLGWTLVIGSASYMIAPDPETGTVPRVRFEAAVPPPSPVVEAAPDTAKALARSERATETTHGLALQSPSGETSATDRADQAPETTLTTQIIQTLETIAAEAGSSDPARGNGAAARAPQPAATQSAALQAGITAARPIAEPKDLAGPVPRPEYMAPIPVRAPRPAGAGAIAVDTRKLFQRGAEIKVKRDAQVYITSRNIPKNDTLLEAYNADQPNGGRVQTTLGEATAVPGLLGIAAQAHRAQDPNGKNGQVYSLADAMRDAIWRKKTAARLKSLTTAQNTCAGGATRKSGLFATC